MKYSEFVFVILVCTFAATLLVLEIGISNTLVLLFLSNVMLFKVAVLESIIFISGLLIVEFGLNETLSYPKTEQLLRYYLCARGKGDIGGKNSQLYVTLGYNSTLKLDCYASYFNFSSQ